MTERTKKESGEILIDGVKALFEFYEEKFQELVKTLRENVRLQRERDAYRRKYHWAVHGEGCTCDEDFIP